MANEVVLDVAEGIGACAADVVDLVEEPGLDPQTFFFLPVTECGCTLHGLQRQVFRASREMTPPQGALDVTEQAVGESRGQFT